MTNVLEDTSLERDLRLANQALLVASVRQHELAEAARAAEAALRVSEANLRHIADSLPQLVWTARPDGYIDYYNERWYEFSGFPRNQFGQGSWEPILHPDDLQRCIDTYFGCIRAEREYQIEYRLKDRKSGGYRWFMGRAVPMRNDQGRVVKWFGTCTDIDDQKRLQDVLRSGEAQQRHSAETFAGLVDQSPFGIYVVDSKFCIYQVSAGAQGAFRNVRPLIGHDFGKAIHIIWPEPLASQIIEIFRRTLETGEPYVAPSLTEQRHDIATTESYEWEIHRITLPDETYGVVCYFFDATRLRQAEKSLREVARRKDEFLATLAHELRNPLAPIRNSLSLLRLVGDDRAAREEVVEVLERQSCLLTRLVDDLLEVSRISRNKIELRMELVELATIVHSAVETSRPLIQAAGHSLSIGLPPVPLWLEVDPMRIGQVFTNLLNNAAKYMDPGGQIQITVGSDAGQAWMSVRDTGIGIAPEMLPRVFDMFTQVDQSPGRAQGGLGIGLTLVRGLVELHGGTVEARSEGLGWGSEFIVRLPLAAAVAPKSPPPAEHPACNLAARRILVVDDNRDAANSLGRLLGVLGADVRIAHDGPAALKVLATFHPEVMLLDLGMPGMDGLEVARQIRRQPEHRAVTLIALTGWGQAEDRRRTQLAGFDHHLTKPVDIQLLLSLLASLEDPAGMQMSAP